jgi:hypothetical protein
MHLDREIYSPQLASPWNRISNCVSTFDKIENISATYYHRQSLCKPIVSYDITIPTPAGGNVSGFVLSSGLLPVGASGLVEWMQPSTNNQEGQISWPSG